MRAFHRECSPYSEPTTSMFFWTVFAVRIRQSKRHTDGYVSSSIGLMHRIQAVLAMAFFPDFFLEFCGAKTPEAGLKRYLQLSRMRNPHAASAVLSLMLFVTLAEGAVWGKGFPHLAPSIATKSPKNCDPDFEAQLRHDDSSPSLLRLRGGIEYYDDRMDLEAAIKALKQARFLFVDDSGKISTDHAGTRHVAGRPQAS